MPQVGEGSVGEAYWRSLDELTQTPELRHPGETERDGLREELLEPATRRAFLKVMGASLGLAGMTSCRWPKETIVPFAARPEGRAPGVPRQFATAFEVAGASFGVLVTSVDGRPVKVEGNPIHPISQGAVDLFAQASVLELYDPDRSRAVVRREGAARREATWGEAESFLRAHSETLRARRGAGLVVLSEVSSSPTMSALEARLRAALPEARWVVYEPLHRDGEREATAALLGSPRRAVLRLDQAEVIVCLGGDLFSEDPAALRHARDFARRRRAEDGSMNRLCVAEPVLTLTGAMADRRLAVPASHVPGLGARLLAEVVRLGGVLPAALGQLMIEASPGDAAEAAFVASTAADLVSAQGKCAVVASPRDGAAQAYAAALNLALGSTCVEYAAARAEATGPIALRELAGCLKGGQVTTLVVLGGNPVYTAPAGLDLRELLQGVPTTVRVGLFEDETSLACGWHLPQAHYLESWGDTRAWDGTVTVQQPPIRPLYGGRSAIEVVAMLLGEKASGHDLVRGTFASLVPGSDERAWRRALHDGLVTGLPASPSPPATPTAGAALPALAARARERPGVALERLEVVVAPDRKVLDGRFANNAWLQELPDPLTRVTWDNVATLAPTTASELGVHHGDLVTLEAGPVTLSVAAYVLPGQAEHTVGLTLGYGRTAAGRVGSGVGFNTFALWGLDAGVTARVAAVARGGHPLACTQDHDAIDRVGYLERGKRVGELVREVSLDRYKAEVAVGGAVEHGHTSLWHEEPYRGKHQWAMAIDLSACLGCGACALACQAENNVPVVGKEQVARSREMHWLRVDRYFAGPPDAPHVVFQPVACQHCELAPCEQVCPVGATMHSDEGLNQMAYNRCVGTRYCSNNCPYKVRRFNYFNYHKEAVELARMVANPNVTVRSRGVMEKCTYCVQRIQAVKIVARNERREVKDGEIIPACAQACPTRAIVFGDLADQGSEVARLHRHDRAYAMLAELDVRPRTMYLTRLRNPGTGEGTSA